PDGLLSRYKLLPRYEALRALHFPTGNTSTIESPYSFNACAIKRRICFTVSFPFTEYTGSTSC
ncbi:hypothetical protein ACT453_32100, partial [Bacillus sp. D-CC]